METKGASRDVLITEESLKHCETEDIAHPEHLQHFGALLAVDTNNGELQRWSENAPNMLGAAAFHIGERIAERFPWLERVLKPQNGPTSIQRQRFVDTITLSTAESHRGQARLFELLAHVPPSQPNLLITELLPLHPGPATDKPGGKDWTRLLAATRRIEASNSISELCDCAAQSVREISGYDRVMVYRFSEDWHGEVVSESTRDGLSARFLGQHFPASDIPAQARDLYRTNPLRIVADIDAPPIALAPGTAAASPLDLSNALLRQPSPFHLAYLANMEVKATLVVSILVDGRLWGMLACHSSSTKAPAYQVRSSVLLLMEIMGQLISHNVAIRTELRATRSRLAFSKKLKALSAAARARPSSERNGQLDDFMALTKHSLGADEALLLMPDQAPVGHLEKEVAAGALEALRAQTDCLITQDVRSLKWFDSLSDSSLIGGVALAPLPDFPGCGIILARNATPYSRDWAGRPGDFGQYERETGEVVLGARRSFDIWRETVKDQSQPWPEETSAILADAIEFLKQQIIDQYKATFQLLGTALDVMQDHVLVVRAQPDAAAGGRPIVYANPALCQRTGYSPDELVGRTTALLHGKQTDMIEVQRIRHALQDGESVEAELTYHARCGEPFLVELKISPVRDEAGRLTHFVSVQRDVTKRRTLEKALHTQNQALQALTERLPGAVYTVVLSPDGRLAFDFFSAGMARLYGLDPAECLDPDMLLARVHPDDKPMLMERISESARQLKSWKTEFRVIRANDNQIKWLRENSQPYRLPDGGTKWYGILEDVTEKRRLGDELERRVRELNAVLETVPEVILDLDANGLIRQIFTSRKSLAGKPLQDFIDQPLDLLMPPEVSRRLFSTKSGGIGEAEFQLSQSGPGRINGDGVHYLARLAPKRTDDEPQQEGYVCSLTDITDRVAAQQLAEWNATHDMLTGLNNRAGLEKAIVLFFRSLPENAPVAAFIIDYDRFQVLNQLYGHHYGDLALIEAAQRLSTWRDQGGLVARIGGDEFVVLAKLPDADATHGETVRHLASKLQATLSGSYQLGDLSYNMDCSIGAAISDDVANRRTQLVSSANLALFEAKQAGGSNIRVFHKSARSRVHFRHKLFEGLKRALREENDELQMAYQPIFHEETVIGQEALLRWAHPDFGWVSPSDFISIAEQSTLILSLGRWVIEKSMEKLMRWAEDPTRREWVLSINVSARQIHQDAFVSDFLGMIDAAGVNPKRLKLEITETLAQVDLKQSIQKLNALRSIGVQISLDDFGTGFSSLSHLQQLPLDEIKLDQKFVRDMAVNEGALAITRMVLSLGKTLGVRVVAEGIETAEQLQQLQQIGYRFFQGHLLGKPELEATE